MSISILSALLLGLLFVLVHVFGSKYKASNYMVVVRFDEGSDVEQKLAALPGYKMKNKTMVSSATELVAEVKLDNAGMAQLSELRNLPGVKEISVMSSTADSVL